VNCQGDVLWLHHHQRQRKRTFLWRKRKPKKKVSKEILHLKPEVTEAETLNPRNRTIHHQDIVRGGRELAQAEFLTIIKAARIVNVVIEGADVTVGDVEEEGSIRGCIVWQTTPTNLYIGVLDKTSGSSRRTWDSWSWIVWEGKQWR